MNAKPGMTRGAWKGIFGTLLFYLIMYLIWLAL